MAPPCTQCHKQAAPIWRGTFCGLARCLARDYGAPARLLVNRDATFLALLGLSLDPEPPKWRHATCCNPIASPFPVNDEHPVIRHAAAVSVCGLGAKLTDDSKDEGALRRTTAKIVSSATSHAMGKAIAELNSNGFPTADVLHALQTQESFEAQNPLQADAPTAFAFSSIFAHLSSLMPLDPCRPSLRRLGSALGSLVYWRDAWEDRTQDQRKGHFNPYLIGPIETIRQRTRHAWHEFSAALDALQPARYAGIFDQLSTLTQHRHAGFIEADDSSSLEPFSKEKTKSRKKKDRSSPWSWCDCYYCDCPSCSCGRGAGCGSRGGAADKCFDCGPGDSGCCDCCPCDGCDCCPCN